MKFGRKKIQETTRKVKANDLEYNGQFKYKNNKIRTSRYNILTFIPLNLFQQFQRVANAYFLMLMILQLIPQISSLSPVTTIIPLVIVLAVTAIKDAYDDYHRHISDNEVNNRLTTTLRDGKMAKEKWMNICVGDIIRINNNEFVSADLLLLSSSEDHNLVYIETAELDGETNLKVRQALPETGMMGDDENALSQFDGRIECEPPNNVLHKFTGTLHWNEQEYGIDNNKILLRGCTLRNTSWCTAMVIFAGPDTKLMKNTGKSQFKRTSLDRLMNTLVWLIFALLITMAIATAIGNTIFQSGTGFYFQVYQPWQYAGTAFKSGFLAFWSYVIILNTVVPISLYVSVEMIRLGQSFFIIWDRQLYYEKKNLAAVARNTSLNEELGQIEYVFSDKTGTLTQNVMEFLKCSIDGVCYGSVYDGEGYVVIPDSSHPKADFSFNPHADENFKFYDTRLVDNMQKNDEKCHEFFRLIAICHTVMPEETENGILYQAQSPDEGALVAAAKNFGFVFKSRTYNSITIEEMGKDETYEVLAILDFDNTRKRMSVIVKDKDGKITLYCKGADSVIYERLGPDHTEEYKNTTTDQLSDFANEGLRTLCTAKKVLTEQEYDIWKVNHERANTTLDDRDEALAAVYEEIEKDMTLLGATAIEDKLQDGVPETVENLKQANIKIWVLTGDKQETAVNIGYSCNMLSEDMKDVFIIDSHTKNEVRKDIADGLKAISNGSSPNNTADQYSNISMDQQQVGEQDIDKYGIVINGHSLAYALDSEMEEEFLNLACQCTTVICCRVTPLQKAQVVDLVKRYKTAVTLAIGDGANDVSMIKAAHIGIGISGEEGTQAVLSSDFAFGQFRFLERLLLVHGRWSYMRMCKFLGYFFYKNFAFTLVHLWFAYFCGWSAMSIYDATYITCYNVVYTSVPVILMGLLDQDVSDENCILYPKLYIPGQKNEYFNKKIFFKSTAKGVIHSLILFFFPYGAVYTGSELANLQSLGLIIAISLTVVVNLEVGLDTAYWTPINHFFIWGSIAVFFAMTFAMYSDGIYIALQWFVYVGVARTTLADVISWLVILLVIVICVLPDVAYRFIKQTYFPQYVDKIMRKQIQIKKQTKKSKNRLDNFKKIKNKLLNRSRPRSGYAFSHEHGFGDLITTGRMSMRRKTQQNGSNAVQEIPSVSQRVSNDLPNSIPTPTRKTTDILEESEHEYEQIPKISSKRTKNSAQTETYRPLDV